MHLMLRSAAPLRRALRASLRVRAARLEAHTPAIQQLNRWPPRELAHADIGRPLLRQPVAAGGAGRAAGAVVAAAADPAGAAAAELPRHPPADGSEPAGGIAGTHAALAPPRSAERRQGKRGVGQGRTREWAV